MQTGTHDLEEEALFGGERNGAVFVGVGDVDKANWRVFGVDGGGLVSCKEGRRGEEEVESAAVGECEGVAGCGDYIPAVFFF